MRNNKNHQTERIAMIIDHLGMESPEDFSDSLGLENPEIFMEIEKGVRDIDPELAFIIHNRFKDISYDWILTGSGNFESEYYLLPLYSDFPVDGSDNSSLFLENIVFPARLFGKPEYAVKVSDGIYPDFPDGKLLFVSGEVTDIEAGQTYYVDTGTAKHICRIENGPNNGELKIMTGDRELDIDISNARRLEHICCVLTAV